MSDCSCCRDRYGRSSFITTECEAWSDLQRAVDRMGWVNAWVYGAADDIFPTAQREGSVVNDVVLQYSTSIILEYIGIGFEDSNSAV